MKSIPTPDTSNNTARNGSPAISASNQAESREENSTHSEEAFTRRRNSEDSLLVKEELTDSTVFPFRGVSPKNDDDRDEMNEQEPLSLNINSHSNGSSKKPSEKENFRHVSAIDLILKASLETARLAQVKHLSPTSSCADADSTNGSSPPTLSVSSANNAADSLTDAGLRISDKISKGHRSRRKMLKTSKVCTNVVGE